MNTLLKRQWGYFFSVLILVSTIAIGATLIINPPGSHAVAIADGLSPKLLKITTFRSPTCGCCGEWNDHMKAAGFEITDTVTEEMEGVKREHNVPDHLAACHTAIVGDYVVEGHIPAVDVKRLLSEKPDVIGITVPGMPLGSPGMESGDITEPYQVLTFNQSGQTTVFASHAS